MTDNPAEAASPEVIWCPYTDTEIPTAASTDEHIIPLSLGGHDALTIPVDGRENSRIGSKIDGAVANEFPIVLQRAKYDLRGHSRSAPEVRTKGREQSTVRPLALYWGKRLRINDPRAQRDRTGVKFEFSFTMDADARLRFLAKCFLSAGYLVYGDLFRRAVAHWEPRLALKKPPREFSKAEGAAFRTRKLDWFGENLSDPKEVEELERQRVIAELAGTVLVFMPGRDCLGIFGGVLGQYLGMLIVPADTTEFPRIGDHELGHTIVVTKEAVYRGSYRVLLESLRNSIARRERAGGTES